MTVINLELERLKKRLQLLELVIQDKRDVSFDFLRSIDLNRLHESKFDVSTCDDQTDWKHGWNTANLSLSLLFLRLIARDDFMSDTSVSELQRLETKMATLELIIKEKCDYSFDLVWYARRRPEDFELAIVRQNVAEVERKYPDHVRSFENNPDWTHGWNSAHLAISRLLLGIIDAEDEVRNLNTHDEFEGNEHYMYSVDDYIRDQIEEYPCLDS